MRFLMLYCQVLEYFSRSNQSLMIPKVVQIQKKVLYAGCHEHKYLFK